MNIVFNGQSKELPNDTTLAELLEQLKLSPQYVAVEVNAEVIPRQQHAEYVLREGDQLEVVTLVGGG